MKKARIILSTIAVLLVVAGALAFKAKKFSQAYCFNAQTTTVEGEVKAAGFCQNVVNSTVDTDDPTVFIYARPTNNTANCANLTCSAISLIGED